METLKTIPTQNSPLVLQYCLSLKMVIFLKGVQIIIFSENGPKIESTAFLS